MLCRSMSITYAGLTRDAQSTTYSLSKALRDFVGDLQSLWYASPRIKVQYEQFANSGMTERNAKHNFIDYCQAMAGYGCQFYKLKVLI